MPENTSLLKPNLRPQVVIDPTVIARSQAAQIKAAPRRLVEQLLQQWLRPFDLLWTAQDGVTPAMRLEEIGTDAAELLQANTALVQFLVAMLEGKDDDTVAMILGKIAALPELTVHEDGRVTLTPPPE